MSKIPKIVCVLALAVGVCPVRLSGFGNPLKDFEKSLAICAVGIAAGSVVGCYTLTNAWKWAFYASGFKKHVGGAILGIAAAGTVFGAGYLAEKLQRSDSRG